MYMYMLEKLLNHAISTKSCTLWYAFHQQVTSANEIIYKSEIFCCIYLFYHLPVHKKIYVYTWSNYFMFSLLLLGEMGHQYIKTDKRTTTNVFMFQKIHKFSII